jgi:hypothetical protein
MFFLLIITVFLSLLEVLGTSFVFRSRLHSAPPAARAAGQMVVPDLCGNPELARPHPAALRRMVLLNVSTVAAFNGYRGNQGKL